MNREDRALVKETKALIKEVESGDTAHAAWVAIQDRVQQLCEDRTQTAVGDLLGKGPDWVSTVVRWDSAAADLPFSAGARGRDYDRNARGARKVLTDPAQRARTFKDMSAAELANVVADADEERHAKVEVKRSEHRTDDSISGIIGSGESLEDLTASITESWADEQIQRVHYTSDKLARHIQKWGLVLGSLSNEQALDLIERAEHDIAETRAALQERVRDNARSNA